MHFEKLLHSKEQHEWHIPSRFLKRYIRHRLLDRFFSVGDWGLGIGDSGLECEIAIFVVYAYVNMFLR